jgi:hypothetical protein
VNRVPKELKYRYLNLVMAMAASRTNPAMYYQLDKRRQEVHEEILQAAGTTREDVRFAMKLAMFTEGVCDEELDFLC